MPVLSHLRAIRLRAEGFAVERRVLEEVLGCRCRVSSQATTWRREELKLVPTGTRERMHARGFKPKETQRLAGQTVPGVERALLP